MTRSSVAAALAVAVAVAALLVAGCKRSAPTAPSSAPVAPVATGGPTQVEKATCPVTGETMKKEDMIPVTYEGKTYYLCCADCKPKFEADPEKYVGPEGKPEAEAGMHHGGGHEGAEHGDVE